MKTARTRRPGPHLTFVVWVAVASIGLAGCAVPQHRRPGKGEGDGEGEGGSQAQVDFAAASASSAMPARLHSALDRYGDILNDTAPTVGDVMVAGADLAEPRDAAFDSAEAAADAQQPS